jgi:hypothetical protein
MNYYLDQLWTLAQREAAKQEKQTKPDYVFSDIGLELSYPPIRGDSANLYYSTPINCSVFGWTGGDAVHFSLLHINDQFNDLSPVVMTVPMNFGSETNWVMGATLTEFLALGCQYGFWQLEQIAYQRSKYPDPAQRHSAALDAGDEEGKPLYDIIRAEFALEKWGDLTARLDELEQMYHGFIEIPPFE